MKKLWDWFRREHGHLVQNGFMYYQEGIQGEREDSRGRVTRDAPDTEEGEGRGPELSKGPWGAPSGCSIGIGSPMPTEVRKGTSGSPSSETPGIIISKKIKTKYIYLLYKSQFQPLPGQQASTPRKEKERDRGT